MTRPRVGGTCFLALMGAVACGSSSHSGNAAPGDGDPVQSTPITAAAIATYEGTYALGSFTLNPTACDVEGPVETSTHKMTFVMAAGPEAKPSYLALVACADDLECADKVAAVRSGGAISGDYVLTLEEQVSADLLRDAGGSYPGHDVDGACTERKYYRDELARSGDTVRVETRTVQLADKPSQAGICGSALPAELSQEAEGRPCTELRVITGTKTGPLPS